MMESQQSELLQSFDHINSDVEEKAKNPIKKEAAEVINLLNINLPKHRAVLAKSYRQINKVIDSLQNDKFNFSKDAQFVQDIVKSAYFFKPYLNFQTKLYSSSIWTDTTKGNRRCKQPLVKVDDQVISFENKKQNIIIKQKQFKLVIQSEPNGLIIYTNKPKTHPLLMENQINQKYFKKVVYESVTQYLTPPCQINMVALDQYQKIQSKLICLKIKCNDGNQNDFNKFSQYAQRPRESFNYEDSNSGYLSVNHANGDQSGSR